MGVNLRRLSGMLEAEGFVQGFPWFGSPAWSRGHSNPDLHEWIVVSSSGKLAEAVYGYAGVGITQRVPFRVDCTILSEIAEIKKRAWTVIHSDAEAATWERRFVVAAPARAQAVCIERGATFLEQTLKARKAAETYLRLAKATGALSAEVAAIKCSFATEEIAAAERLVNSSGVCQAAVAVDLYFLACLIIARYSREVGQGELDILVQSPSVNLDLMWRIQLIADACSVASR